MARLVKKNQAIKLNMPTVGNPARFKLLVSKESLLHTQKFAGPKMAEVPDCRPKVDETESFAVRTLDRHCAAESARDGGGTLSDRQRCPLKMLL
jgi:hypothetical protein